MRTALIDGDLTHSVVGAFFEVYNTLGFGFLENLYARALERELISRGHDVKREFAVSVRYKGEVLGHHRLDMVVDDRLVIEIKATENLHRDSQRQLFNYLRATNIEVGLLLHFSPSGARFFRQVCSNARGQSAQSAESA
jgi:GxxExxY protein